MANKNLTYRSFLLLINLSVFYGCKKTYAPQAVRTNSNFLVVEGVINSGGDSTVVKLSRTVNIAGQTTAKPEQGAVVTIEDNQDGSYPLHLTDSGRYVSAPLNTGSSRQYRLNIKTKDGHTYLSDLVESKTTPPIDTFNYVITSTGVNFYTSTHDAANKTKYYRWDYTETYIYESPLAASYVFDNSSNPTSNKFKQVTADNQTHLCYVNVNSSSINLASTANLSGDIINNNPIAQVSSTSEKFLHRYSIVVRQYALTPDAYEFWTRLRKNTEQIGNIFDAQPSDLTGNIHCTSNPSEPVIGFISASTVTQKRVFIDNRDLPAWPVLNSDSCSTQLLKWYGAAPFELTSATWIPVGPLGKRFDSMRKDSAFSIKVGDYNCVDCRYHLHGVNKKPAFWK